jgi:hypothetical protein
LILAAALELVACPKVEVRLGPGVSKLDVSSMSLVGKLLESGSRGIKDTSSEVSTVVPESLAVAPEPVSPVVNVVGLFDAHRDYYSCAIVGLVSPKSLVVVDPVSPTVVSASPMVAEAPVKTTWKSSPAKGLLRRGFLGSSNVLPVLGDEDSFTVLKVGSPTVVSQAS